MNHRELTPKDFPWLLEQDIRNLAIDTETYTDASCFPYPYIAKLHCFSLAWDKESAYVIMDGPEARSVISELIRRATRVWMHNALYDVIVLQQHGISVPSKKVFDTQVASWMLGLGPYNIAIEKRSVSLKALASHIFSITYSFEWEDVRKAPQRELVRYASLDAHVTFRLAEICYKQLHSEKLWRLFVELEMPTVFVIKHMARYGISLDRRKLLGIAGELQETIEKCEQEAYTLTKHLNPPLPVKVDEDGRYHSHDGILKKYWLNHDPAYIRPKYRKHTHTAGVSLTSSTQIRKYFMGKKKLWTTKGVELTDKGVYSTDNRTVSTQLRTLKPGSIGHEFARIKQEHGKAFKLRSAFTDTLIEMSEVYKDRRLRPNFRQTGTLTGRFSCSEPNLQQLPKDSDIRACLVPSPGYVLWGADYSQLEIRIAAHFSRDPMLLKVIHEGLSQHDITAESLGIPRADAKTINFALQYGAGPSTLAKGLGMELITKRGKDGRTYNVAPQRAKDLWESYHETYGGVTAWREKVIKDCERDGYITTISGRRVYIYGIDSSNRALKARAERQAANAIIQGSAADIIKKASLEICRNLPKGSRLLLQIHDEVVGECPVNSSAHVLRIVKKCMEGVYDLGDIPLSTDPATGNNMKELK